MHPQKRILKFSAAAFFLVLFLAATANGSDERRLGFYQTHTEERLQVTYKQGGRYVPEALEKISYIMRDYRTGQVHPMEPKLLDFLYDLLTAVNNHGEVHIISAYRSAETNKKLHEQDDKGVSQRSFHMQGRALDFRLPGTDTKRLRDTALSMKRGGVGYYPESDFIQIDTGRVRFW